MRRSLQFCETGFGERVVASEMAAGSAVLPGFVLGATLQAGAADVRSICVAKCEERRFIACGDRGNSLTLFEVGVDNTYGIVGSWPAHEGWISCMCFIPLTNCIVTGSYDKTIRHWLVSDLAAGNAVDVGRFEGDSEVVSLDAGDDGQIVSGHLDGSGCLWADPQVRFRHEKGAIWGVAMVGEKIVTGGADHSLRLWSKAGVELSRVAEAHADCVRCVREQNGKVWTAGNDGVVRGWQVGAASLVRVGAVTVSDKYLYCLAVFEADVLVVGGEDRIGYLVAAGVIDMLPTLGVVWCAEAVGNGDVALGCGDGTVRVFTRDGSRVGEEGAYLNELAKGAVYAPELLQLNREDIPREGMTADRTPGRATLVRLADDALGVQIWSPGYGRFISLGKVTGEKGRSERVKDEDGRVWDYMLTVELEDGRQLPLYLNHDTNQYVASRDFLLKHNLQMIHFEQIAKFIERERRPVRVQSTRAAPQSEVRSALFPLKEANFLVRLNAQAAVAKLLELLGGGLSADDAERLRVPRVGSFDVAMGLLTRRPIGEVWPVLELIRGWLCDPSARVLVNVTALFEWMCTVPKTEERVVWGCARILGNLFAYFEAEAFEHFDVVSFAEGLLSAGESLSSEAQLWLANALMNASVYLEARSAYARRLLDVVFQLLERGGDEQTMMRVVWAIGTCAVADPACLALVAERRSLLKFPPSPDISPAVDELKRMLAQVAS